MLTNYKNARSQSTDNVLPIYAHTYIHSTSRNTLYEWICDIKRWGISWDNMVSIKTV